MLRILSAVATGIGLLTGKYMLGATNLVEHYANEFHASDSQKDFVKAAMYAGSMLGMIVMGPASDYHWTPLGSYTVLRYHLARCSAFRSGLE